MWPLLSYARRVLDEMPEQGVVCWTASTQGIVAEGDGRKGMHCLVRWEGRGVLQNYFAVATSLKAWYTCLDVSLGKQVQAAAVTVG
ncbi:hypothetical protein DEO72_LG9g2979 [Vigna unguiculata]|uniref:Uncharacterized protein n=1 Tax=Vigna unguiculata TaxID=3917 RepID=A0A4D6N2G5_VIGUN|nr:hypothetical protein DEO72_LG9g2979 [Vigna unguiculata]